MVLVPDLDWKHWPLPNVVLFQILDERCDLLHGFGVHPDEVVDVCIQMLQDVGYGLRQPVWWDKDEHLDHPDE